MGTKIQPTLHSPDLGLGLGMGWNCPEAGSTLFNLYVGTIACQALCSPDEGGGVVSKFHEGAVWASAGHARA